MCCRMILGRSVSTFALTFATLILSGCDGNFTTGPADILPAGSNPGSANMALAYVVAWVEDSEPVQRVVTPVETPEPVEDFYTRGVPYLPGASTGYEVAGAATLMLHRDSNTGLVSLVAIYDASGEPDGDTRHVRTHLDGTADDIAFPVLDDLRERPGRNQFGVVTLVHQWPGGSTDGWAARGGLEDPFSIRIRLRDVIGLTGIGWVDGDEERIPVPMGGSETAIDIGAAFAPSDDTPPVITASVAGTLGQNGWYTSDVDVSWTTTDEESGITETAGCDDATVDEDTDGVTFTCQATSAGGTASESVTLKRDVTPPVVTFAGNEGSYDVGDVVTITCDAYDALSRLAWAECPEADAPAWTFGPGSTTLTGSAADNAGTEATASTTFVVDATGDGICALAREWIDNGGVAEALCAKLPQSHGSDAGPAPSPHRIRAFVHQVDALRGRWLTDRQADLLIELARTL